MAEEKADNLLNELKSTKKVLCRKCKNGYYIPYNTTADKAHTFYCSNSECDSYIHIDPLVDIE